MKDDSFDFEKEIIDATSKSFLNMSGMDQQPIMQQSNLG